MSVVTRVIGLVVVMVLLLPAPSAVGKTCTRQSGPAPSVGSKLKSPIKLTPERDTELVNFGSERGIKERDVLVLADDPLPKSVTPNQIGLDLPRRFERVSDTLETAELAAPTCTKPVISRDRTEIKF